MSKNNSFPTNTSINVKQSKQSNDNYYQQYKKLMLDNITQLTIFCLLFFLFVCIVYWLLKRGKKDNQYLLEHESQPNDHEVEPHHKEINLELESQNSKENNIVDTKTKKYNDLDKSIDSAEQKKYQLK